MPHYFRHKKLSENSGDGDVDIDYKDIETLKMYVMESGRIIPARITGVSPKQQRQLAKSIKIARFLALLPFSDRQ
jgi:small subunit ribosomal protein S18